jgi:hypothetical protein
MARTFYRKKFTNYLGEQRAIDDIVLFFTADIGPGPTPTPSITPSHTPTPSITPSSTPIISVTTTPTPTQTNTPTTTTTLTATPTLTPTQTPTSSGLGCDFTYFVNPTPTPTITSTSTPTPTPAVIPPPQNGMLLGIDASDPDCYPGSGTTVYNLAPSQTTGTTFSDVSWNTNYFGFVETSASKIEFTTNSYNITGTAWTYIMYFMPLSSNSAYLAEKSLGYDSLSLVYGYNGETCRPWMNTYRGMNPVSAPVNELTFVAFTKDANGVPNNYKSYRNGVLQQEFSEDFSLGAQSGFVFNNFDPGQYRLYNFYFYERALTSQEINDIYSYVTS